MLADAIITRVKSSIFSMETIVTIIWLNPVKFSKACYEEMESTAQLAKKFKDADEESKKHCTICNLSNKRWDFRTQRLRCLSAVCDDFNDGKSIIKNNHDEIHSD